MRNCVCDEGGEWGTQTKRVFANNIIDSCTYASKYNDILYRPSRRRTPCPKSERVLCCCAVLIARLDEMAANGRRLVIDVDEMELLKGMPLTLLGFEQMIRSADGDTGATLVQVHRRMLLCMRMISW